MSNAAPDKAVLREELETARRAFHELLEAIPAEVWNVQAANSAWTVRQEMWHIAWGARFMLNLIKNARRGIGLPKPPMRIADRLNALYTRLRSLGATRSSIARRYDKTHRAVLAELDAIQEQDWSRVVSVFGEKQDLLYLLEGIPHHFEEHAARIRPLLAGRPD